MQLTTPFGKSKSRASEELSGVVNSAKTLLANIRFMSVDNPVHSIVITSAVPNEGKTFVAANLTSAIATSGHSVLVVECDMRRRSMAHALGVHAQHGIYSVLAGEVPLTQAVVSLKTPGMYFLDAEPHIPNPSDLMNSHRFQKLIEQALDTYEYVIFDTPPVGTFVDAAVLGTKVDAVFMVVRENFTKKAEVAAAAEQLKKSGCNLAGVVMNYCERRRSEYYYEYYYSKNGHNDSDAPSRAGRRPITDEPVPQRPVPQRPVPSRPSRQQSAADDTNSLAAARQQAQKQPAPTRAVSMGSGDPSDTDMYIRLAESASASSESQRRIIPRVVPSIDEDI
jgi:capsular exopolysaccharide synthesis family protein